LRPAATPFFLGPHPAFPSPRSSSANPPKRHLCVQTPTICPARARFFITPVGQSRNFPSSLDWSSPSPPNAPLGIFPFLYFKLLSFLLCSGKHTLLFLSLCTGENPTPFFCDCPTKLFNLHFRRDPFFVGKIICIFLFVRRFLLIFYISRKALHFLSQKMPLFVCFLP